MAENNVKAATVSNHLSIGLRGEQLAAEWLHENGFTLLERNWRCQKREIDLIATKDNVLHFVEVKTRRQVAFGMPETQVDNRKLHSLRIAAAAYLEEHPQWRRVQFDILAIRLLNAGVSIDFLEDVS